MQDQLNNLFLKNQNVLSEIPKVSTITMLLQNEKPINIAALIQNIRNDLFCDDNLSIKQDIGKFRNCCILTLKNEINTKRKTSIKVFSNGSIHVTGATEVNDTVIMIQNTINTATIELINITNVNVQMMNVIFKCKWSICLISFFEYLNLHKKDGESVIFDKSHHSAINFKMDMSEMSGNTIGRKKTKRVTALIFKTGTIIIGGATEFSQIGCVFHRLLDCFNMCDKSMFSEKVSNEVKIPKKRGRKRKVHEIEANDNLFDVLFP